MEINKNSTDSNKAISDPKKIIQQPVLENKNLHTRKIPQIVSFALGVFSTILFATVVLWVYLNNFDGRINKIIKLQEQYFKNNLSSFSEGLLNNTKQEFVQYVENDYSARKSELQNIFEEQRQNIKNVVANQLSQTEQGIIHSINNTTDQLSQIEQGVIKSINQTKNELVNEVPTEIRNKLFESRKAEIERAEQGLLIAKNLMDQNMVARATLFFSNAINKDPGNVNTLEKYSKSVNDWCRQQENIGDLEVALNVLNETDRFLRTQAVSVHPKDIPKLEELIFGIDQARSDIKERMLNKRKAISAERAANLKMEAQLLLQEQIPVEEKNLSEYIDELHLLSGEIQSLPDFIALNFSDLEKRIESRLKSTNSQFEVISILNMIETEIAPDKITDESSGMYLYKIATLNTLAHRLSKLQLEVSPKMSNKINVAYNQINKRIQDIYHIESKMIWDEIYKESKNIKIYMTVHDGTKCKEAIQSLSNFNRYAASKIGSIVDDEYREKLNSLLTDIGSAISAWSMAQSSRYDFWAIQKIESFHNQYESELGAGTDEERLYDAMIHYLGEIDIRFLSPPASMAYSEVFGLYKKELDDNQKIQLSSEIALMDKYDIQNL